MAALVVAVFICHVIKRGEFDEVGLATLAKIKYAPVPGLPWAFSGAIVGALAAWRRAICVVRMACIGMTVGGIATLVEAPFDGWLTLKIPFFCFIGTIVGLLVGLMRSVSDKPTRATGRTPQVGAHESNRDDHRHRSEG